MRNNRISLTLAATLIATVLIVAGGCKKKKEKVYPQYPPPSWKTEVTGQFTYSMTAVVKLPRELETAWQPADELAAFIGEQCRAVAEPVQAGGGQLFYLLIQGDAAEAEKVTFRYFSAATSYIYMADNTLKFTPDGVYGSVDEPRTLVLKPRE